MTDLLVSSLMADGGLKTALRGAIKMEVKELTEEAEKGATDSAKDKPFTGEELMTEQVRFGFFFLVAKVLYNGFVFPLVRFKLLR